MYSLHLVTCSLARLRCVPRRDTAGGSSLLLQRCSDVLSDASPPPPTLSSLRTRTRRQTAQLHSALGASGGVHPRPPPALGLRCAMHLPARPPPPPKRPVPWRTRQRGLGGRRPKPFARARPSKEDERSRRRNDVAPPPRAALEGKGPQRRPQRRLGRRLEEVVKAVGGGYCRLQMPLKRALAVRETVAGHRQGALEGGGGTSPPSNASLPPPRPPHRTPVARVHKRRSAQGAGRKLAHQWPTRPEVPFCHKVRDKRMAMERTPTSKRQLRGDKEKPAPCGPPRTF